VDTNTVRPLNNLQSKEPVPEKKVSFWDKMFNFLQATKGGGSQMKHTRPSKGSTKAHRKIKRKMSKESRRRNR
jgi:hypothetical protein